MKFFAKIVDGFHPLTILAKTLCVIFIAQNNLIASFFQGISLEDFSPEPIKSLLLTLLNMKLVMAQCKIVLNLNKIKYTLVKCFILCFSYSRTCKLRTSSQTAVYLANKSNYSEQKCLQLMQVQLPISYVFESCHCKPPIMYGNSQIDITDLMSLQKLKVGLFNGILSTKAGLPSPFSLMEFFFQQDFVQFFI